MAQIQEFQNLVSNALEVVEFKLIRSKSDLQNEEAAFHPMMAHQLFGESESIFGYQNLKVRLLYTAGPLNIYLSIEYDKKVDELSAGAMKADDVMSIIAEKLPEGCYFVNMDEFLKTLDTADKFQPYGTKLCEYYVEIEKGEMRCFAFYCSNYKQPPFLKFFSRLQTFVLWFIDAATYIDVDDPQWNYFVCYEKYKNDEGEETYATVGYATIYEYYAYPQNIRPRISQMLVLPPFQKMGIGTALLESIYRHYQGQKRVKDITVEDPSDGFQRMRNIVDSRSCLRLKSFQSTEIKKGFNKEMIKEAREILKLNPRQCRKVYEILRYLYTNIYNNNEYRSYRLDVKKRLNAVYQKQMNDITKMEKSNVDTEWLRARLPGTQTRLEQLQEEYEKVEREYQTIIDKII